MPALFPVEICGMLMEGLLKKLIHEESDKGYFMEEGCFLMTLVKYTVMVTMVNIPSAGSLDNWLSGPTYNVKITDFFRLEFYSIPR